MVHTHHCQFNSFTFLIFGMVKARSPGCTQSLCSAHTRKLCAHTHKVTLRCCSTLETCVTSGILGRQEHHQWVLCLFGKEQQMAQPPSANSQSSQDTRYYTALHYSITRLLHHPLLNCSRPALTKLTKMRP